MLFRSAVTFFVGALFAQGVVAAPALTPNDVVKAIKAVTATSQNANDALSIISTSTSILQVKTASKSLVTGFTTIVTSITTVVPQIKSNPAFPDDAGDAIVEALTDFVVVHQLLLSTVIGKHSIFAQFALTAPIAAVLRLLEAQVDALAFALISLIPTHSKVVQSSQKTLDISITANISTYTEFCIPSPFYPVQKPKCIAV